MLHVAATLSSRFEAGILVLNLYQMPPESHSCSRCLRER